VNFLRRDGDVLATEETRCAKAGAHLWEWHQLDTPMYRAVRGSNEYDYMQECPLSLKHRIVVYQRMADE